MEKKLGNSYSTINRMLKSVEDEVYLKDIHDLQKGLKIERKESIYLIFREVNERNLGLSTVYVGKTKKMIGARFEQHLSTIKSMSKGDRTWNSKYLWMYQVMTSGGILSIIELNKVQSSKVYYYEENWIDYLSRMGFKLLNRSNKNYYNNRILSI